MYLSSRHRRLRLVGFLCLLIAMIRPVGAAPATPAPLRPMVTQSPCAPFGGLTARVYIPAVFGKTADAPIIAFSQLSYQIGEAGGAATIQLNLSTPASSYLFVDLYTVDQDAKAGSDYVPVTTTLRFVPGETSKTVPIAVINDTVIEQPEQLLIYLVNPRSVQLSSRAPASLLIRDDDSHVAIQPSMMVRQPSAARSYQWAVHVDADDAAVNTPMNSPQPIGYTVNVRRGDLGPTLYQVTGLVTATNTGTSDADLHALTARLDYQLGSTQWLTATDDVAISHSWLTVPPNTARSTPFTLTFTFNTSDGGAPPSLSALRIVSQVTLVDQLGIVTGPFSAVRSISVPLPTPTILLSQVTVAQSGVVTPTGVVQIVGGAGPMRVISSTPLQQHVVYTATRTAPPAATLQHAVSLREMDLTVTADTRLQDTGPIDLPTLELRDVEPVDAYINTATAMRVTLRARPGVGFNPAAIHLAELDPSGAVLRPLAQFFDDGAHGDGLAGDGLFGATGSVTWTSTGQKRLAARATLLTGGTLTVEAMPFLVRPQRPQSDWDIYDCVGKGASVEFERALSRQSVAQAQAHALQWASTRIGVANAFITADGDLIMRLSSGLEAVANVRDPNSIALAGGRGRSSVTTKPPLLQLVTAQTNPPRIFPTSNEAVILNTIPTLVFNTQPDYAAIRQSLINAGYALTVLTDRAASIAQFKQLDRYGVIITMSHAGWTVVNGAHMHTFTTGEHEVAGSYKLDIEAGRLAVGKADGRFVYYTRSSFYSTYYANKRFPNTLWMMIQCSALERQDFANILHDRGVRGVVGFDTLVYPEAGLDRMRKLLANMSVHQMGLWDAWSRVPERTFTWRDATRGLITVTFVLSNRSSPDLLLSGSGFRNSNFEQGSLSGWGRQPSRGFAEVFRVPVGFEHLAGLYAARLGPSTYPPANGVNNTNPGIDRLFQTVLVPTGAQSLQFDYVMSTYLPANGSFVLKVYQANSPIVLDQVEIKRYPGYGQQQPDFWYSGELHYRYDLRRFAGREIRFVFENQQNGRNDQAVYLDNVNILSR